MVMEGSGSASAELLCGTGVLLTRVPVSGWEAVWEQQQAPESWFCGVLIQLAGRPVGSHVGLRAQASCADDRPEGDCVAATVALSQSLM